MFALSERSSHRIEQKINANMDAAAVPSAESPLLTAFFRISSFEIMTLTKRCESELTRNRTRNEAMNIDTKTMSVDSEKPHKSSLVYVRLSYRPMSFPVSSSSSSFPSYSKSEIRRFQVWGATGLS